MYDLSTDLTSFFFFTRTKVFEMCECTCGLIICDPPGENGQKRTEIFSKLNLNRKLICKKLHKFR